MTAQRPLTVVTPSTPPVMTPKLARLLMRIAAEHRAARHVEADAA